MFGLTNTMELTSTDHMVAGCSKTVQSLNAVVSEVAATELPVLIIGESGTGKEVYARLLHRLSAHSGENFRKLNCSILESSQLLKQLHVSADESTDPRGSGTLFIDALDELELAAQRVLLSVLPDTATDEQLNSRPFRLISSTTHDLESAAKADRFRRDLYFRAAGVCLRLPPLRDRKEDIQPLLDHFLGENARKANKPTPIVAPETMEVLLNYAWPGNIRELENLAKRIVALGDSRSFTDELRPGADRARGNMQYFGRTPSLKLAAKAASRQKERELILEALERTRWNRKRAAAELRISYKALLYKLKQIGSPDGIDS